MLLQVTKKTQCPVCDGESLYVSRSVGACVKCLREAEVLPETVVQRHAESRRRFGLPESPPKEPDGAACPLCVNECRIPDGGWGYCRLRTAVDGKLVHAGGTPAKGMVEWYYDHLPTNCVATPVCPGGTGAGYPNFAVCPGPERGFSNLAVFYKACSYNCLYCQNTSGFKSMQPSGGSRSAKELAQAAESNSITCICFFGGDPSVQMPHALAASKLAVRRARAQGRILRICFETNATMHPSVADRMAELVLETGGVIKVDLKAYDENIHLALTGTTNSRTLENFTRIGRRVGERPEVPLLVASTLLVPGYLDPDEVSRIARFIASVDPDIPYVLLAFHPCFEMGDLPPTDRALAKACFEAACAEGLKQVFIGNEHLLW